MCRCVVQLYLMFWKCTLHTFRHNIPKTIFDFLVPVAFFLLMTLSRKEHEPQKQEEMVIIANFTDEFYSPPYGPKLLPVIAYAPNNSVFDKIIAKADQYFDEVTYIPVDNAENLEALLMRNRSIIAGIQFNHPDNITEIPNDFNLSLRFPAMMRWSKMPWPTDILYKEQLFYRFPRNTPPADFYLKEGFTNILFRIPNMLHLDPHANNTYYLYKFVTKPFPHHPQNLNFDKFQFLLPPLVLICFYYPYLCTICCIVVEKNKQTKEMMKLMGLSNWVYWLSLFVRKILLQILTVTIVVAVMQNRLGNSKAILDHSNSHLVWLFLIAYGTCVTSLAFLLGVLFTDINLAVAVSTIIWFLSFLPFSITHVGYTVPDDWKMLMHILPNTAMGYGIKLIFLLELMTEDGLDWSTLWSGLYPYDTLSVGIIMCVMMYTSIVYLVILIYFIPMCPGAYGVASPIHYPLTADFWSRRRTGKYKRSRKGHLAGNQPGIQITNLKKEFVKGKAVLRNVSLDIYQNELTVLCGPNGGGMTSLMLIATGFIKPTSGTVLIDGYDIQKRRNLARKSIGFCPQQNILLDELTAREHILFYSLCKGASIKAAYADVKKYSKLLEFEKYLKVSAPNLSAGTQRKLSLAIALCGRSKYVFLDHPTHGTDPTVRRLIWNVLRSEKKGRHILMTTHSSDEIDTIADRIAFMANGEIKCCGSSIGLRKRFANYRLVCVKDDDCKSNTTTRLLEQYFPGTTIETESKSQMSYLLSYNKIHKFGRFFEKLESSYVTLLKLKSFSIALVTAEFVFHEFTEDLQRDDTSIKSLQIEDQDDSQCLNGIALIPYQISAMFMKRFLFGISNWLSFLSYILIAIVLLVPIVWDLNLRTVRERNPPPLELSRNPYENSYCFFENETYVKESLQSRIGRNISDGFQLMFASQPDNLIRLNATELPAYAQQFGVQKYRFNFLFGGSLKHRRHIYANTFSALHSLPISFNLMMTSRLYAFRNLTIINEPLPLDDDAIIDSTTTEYANMEAFGMDFPIFIAIVMAVISSAHSVFYIKENASRQKLKQYVTGVNHFIFWTISIVWDLCMSIVPIVAIVTFLHLSERPFWSEIGTLYVVAAIIFIFNWAMLPIICFLSLIVSNPATGVSVFCGVNMLIAMTLFVNNYGVEFIPENPSIIKGAMSTIPTCALIECFTILSTIGQGCRDQCDDICDDQARDKLCYMNPRCCPPFRLILENNDIRREISFMACTGAVFLILLLLMEHEFYKQLLSYLWNFTLRPTVTVRKTEYDTGDDDSDSDGSTDELIGDGEQKSESCFPNKSEKSEEKVAMLMVSKYYGWRLVVDQISLYVKLGECVGMIGKNGTGKTTIFKMLTGEQRICYGKAFLLERNLKWNARNTHDFVGYCPQIDTLWPDFTVSQTLRFFCLLRGVEFDQTSDLASNLNLRAHFDQKLSKLSGGHRQILAVVIALIGCPTIILLDTATTCIDMKTKRTLWGILNEHRDAGKSILLASDCMEEYQALCTRFVVDEGTDASSVLKKEPSSIELYFETFMGEYEINNAGIMEFMKGTFKEAQLRSNYKNYLTYDIPYTKSMLAKLFITIEKRKRPLCIENYYVSVQ